MGGNEWLDALPPGVTWSHLPGAPVELVDTVGDAHLLMPEDVSFFVEHLGWTTPPVYEPEDELIEEWRAKIAEYDARPRAGLAGSGSRGRSPGAVLGPSPVLGNDDSIFLAAYGEEVLHSPRATSHVTLIWQQTSHNPEVAGPEFADLAPVQSALAGTAQAREAGRVPA